MGLPCTLSRCPEDVCPSMASIKPLKPWVGTSGAHDLQAILNASLTSVCELGGYGVELSMAIAESASIGPNIYSALSPINIIGSHGDAHNTPFYAIL